MDGFGGQLAVLHGLDGKVLAQGGAVAAGIYARQAGLQGLVNTNALTLAGQLRSHRVDEAGIVEALADGLEDCIGGQLEGFAGVAQAAVRQFGAGKAHAAHLAGVVQQHGVGAGPGVQAHLVGLGDVLLVAGGAHVGVATAVHQVDVAGPQAAHLHGHVDGGIASTDHQAAVGQG